MVRLGRRQRENLERAARAVEAALGPVGEVGVLTHADCEGCFDPESGKVWVGRRALVTVEIAVEGILQGFVERESGCQPLTEGFELYMRRLLARAVLQLQREREGRRDGLAQM